MSFNTTALKASFIALLAAVGPITKVSASLGDSLSSAGVTAYLPGSSDYDQARLAFNRRFDLKPAAIAYPTSSAQVAAAVQAGAAQNMQVVARSGGHSYIANGLGGKDGALVVDLSKLTSITVDTNANTATIQTGNRLGDVATALNNKGRALPHGTCPYVGIGGHVAHGGYGFTSRMWGLTLDTVVSAEVVLANGTVTTASKDTNSDIFWAIRGAAPSFGIVTSITTSTKAVPSSISSFNYVWDLSASDTAKAITNFQSFAKSSGLPAALGTELQFWNSGTKNHVQVSLTGAYYGDSSKLSAALKPFLDSMAKPSSSSVKQQNWIQHLEALAGDGGLDTHSAADETDTFYAKSLVTPDAAPMSSASITALANYMANEAYNFGYSWFIQIEMYGGTNSVINTVGADDTAYPWRKALFAIQFYASSPSYEPPYPDSGFTIVNGLVNAVTSNNPSDWNYGGYANYIDDKTDDWRRLYYGSHYDRLKSIKKAVDPDNVFNYKTSVELA